MSGSLAPGEAITVRFIPQLDGGFRLIGYLDNEFINYDEIGYYTYHGMSRHIISIQEDGEIEYYIEDVGIFRLFN